MFDVNHLEDFYKYDKALGDNQDISNEVKKSYYIFMTDFVTKVSRSWDSHLKLRAFPKTNATLARVVTTSDETFTWWLVKTRSAQEKQNASEIAALDGNIKAWKENHKKKARQGARNSRIHKQLYNGMYSTIAAHRKDANAFSYWNSIFLTNCLKKRINTLKRRKEL